MLPLLLLLLLALLLLACTSPVSRPPITEDPIHLPTSSPPWHGTVAYTSTLLFPPALIPIRQARSQMRRFDPASMQHFGSACWLGGSLSPMMRML